MHRACLEFPAVRSLTQWTKNSSSVTHHYPETFLLLLLFPSLLFCNMLDANEKITTERSGSQGRLEICSCGIVINYVKGMRVGILIVSLMLGSQMVANFIWCTEQFSVLLLKEKTYLPVRLNLCSLLLSKAKPFSFSPMLIRTSNVKMLLWGPAWKLSRRTRAPRWRWHSRSRTTYHHVNLEAASPGHICGKDDKEEMRTTWAGCFPGTLLIQLLL